MIRADEVGKKIAEYRKHKGWTQKELAEKLYVTDKAVSKWERGINFPELTVMERLAEVLDTTVVELLSLHSATNIEVVETVSEISVSEKQHILKELTIRSYLKILIDFVLIFALIQTSKILNIHGIHGKGQMLTIGLLGFVGSLIGMEIFTLRKLNEDTKIPFKKPEWRLSDTLLVYIAVIAVLVYLGIQFFTGSGPNDFVQAILLIIIMACVQIIIYHKFELQILKNLPLFFTILFGLWGTWLYLTSEHWVNAELSDLICGNISPIVGCLVGKFLTAKIRLYK